MTCEPDSNTLPTSRSRCSPASYPEQQDIVLAGPGEGWKITEQGAVVGRTNGLPMLTLDDLLVAFRTTQQARQALQAGRFAEAQQLAQQAQTLNAEFTALEDNPGLVLADVRRTLQSGLEVAVGDGHHAEVFHILAGHFRFQVEDQVIDAHSLPQIQMDLERLKRFRRWRLSPG